MAANQLESRLIHLDDIPYWVQSIVEFMGDTQAKCLDFRLVPDYSTFQPMGVDIKPILDALAGSAITEVYLDSRELNNRVNDFYGVLQMKNTKIEKLNLLQCDLRTDDILRLIALLHNTKISELDISRGIDLVNDQVDEFFTQIANSNLRSLKLSYGSIDPIERMSVLSDLFRSSQITELTRLKLSSVFPCNIDPTYSNDALNILISSLKSTSLTRVILKQSNLNNSLARVLGAILENSSLPLRKLNLRGNKIGDRGLNDLVHGLVKSRIIYLNLSCNRIKGNNNLGKLLSNTKIRELDLSGNPITERAIFQASGSSFLQGTAVFKLKLSNCFGKNCESSIKPIKELEFSKLVYVDLSNNNLGEDQISALSRVLPRSNITHIDLHGNKLSGEDYSVLRECLINSKLQYINLSETLDVSKNIAHVDFFLKETRGSSIASIDLKRCFIGPRAIMRIVETIANTPIATLNLSDNSIGDEGAGILANYLEKTNIVSLDLSHNDIRCQGAIAMAEVLRTTKLQQLNLSSNGIKDEGLQSLAEKSKDSFITTIDVSNNPSTRKLLLDRVLWNNRKRLQLHMQTRFLSALSTSDRDICVFNTAANFLIVN